MINRYVGVLAVAMLIAAGELRAQSIHQIEIERHRDDAPSAAADGAPTVRAPQSMALAKRVFGWVPYWIAPSAYASFDWTALTTIGHFSYEVDTLTGGARSLHGWPVATLRDAAHANGVAIVLTVTNFGHEQNRALLSSPQRRANLATALANAVASGGGDGVNIDFESVPGSERDNLTAFMRELATRVRAAVPDAEISMAIPAVDWTSAFDVSALDDVCDYLIMMGYDYHWRSAPQAGPVAPLAGESLNITRSLQTYLGLGVAPGKLMLGVPWYGYDWPTVDSSRGAATAGTGSPALYATAVAAARSNESLFDAPTSSPWYRYVVENQWHQAWYDDSLSLALKYRLVNEMGLAGIGIWALGYQGENTDVWQGIHQAFDAPSSARGDATTNATIAVDASVLRLTIPHATAMRIELYDLLGRKLLTLAEGQFDAGAHIVPIDAGQLARGAYIVRASALVDAVIYWNR
jgi:spore germination protein YaaH